MNVIRTPIYEIWLYEKFRFRIEGVYDLLGKKLGGFTVKIGVVGCSGPLVCNYQVTWRHIPGYHIIDISIVSAPYAEINVLEFPCYLVSGYNKSGKKYLALLSVSLSCVQCSLAARNLRYRIMVEEETLNLRLCFLSDAV